MSMSDLTGANISRSIRTMYWTTLNTTSRKRSVYKFDIGLILGVRGHAPEPKAEDLQSPLLMFINPAQS